MRLNTQIDMVSLVSQFVSLEKSGSTYKALCPFHDDNNTKSFTVYLDHAHCFGCNGHWDAVDFIKSYLNLDFRGAVSWIKEHRPDLNVTIQQQRSSRHSLPVHPIPQMVIDYWHEMLGERRSYYHSRLLTDDTIDFYKLGWTGISYVIPVWENRPGDSNVYNVRFRKATEDTRDISKYWGIKGRNQPKLFNKWLLNSHKTAYIFIGEFDTLLAAQDGLCAVSSTAGQNTWLMEWTRHFNTVDRIYVVPDVGEETAAYRIASNFLGRAKVCSYPRALGIKDYTEFRQVGYTVDDFRDLVLR